MNGVFAKIVIREMNCKHESRKECLICNAESNNINYLTKYRSTDIMYEVSSKDVNPENLKKFYLCGNCMKSLMIEAVKMDTFPLDKNIVKLIPIESFVDFNYETILLDITGVDREMLKEKLERDFIEHLWQLEGKNYIAIWNCDLQGFHDRSEVCFDSSHETYAFAKLVYDNGWFYYIVESDVPIPEDNSYLWKKFEGLL